MSLNGEQLLSKIAERLTSEGTPCKDSDLVLKLRSLDSYELYEIVTMNIIAKNAEKAPPITVETFGSLDIV